MDSKDFLLIQWFGVIQTLVTIILFSFVIEQRKNEKNNSEIDNNK